MAFVLIGHRVVTLATVTLVEGIASARITSARLVNLNGDCVERALRYWPKKTLHKCAFRYASSLTVKFY